jgi:DNA-binding response OmpR family regulator
MSSPFQHYISMRYFRPHTTFSRDDASGFHDEPGERARILLVEDDYLIASQVEVALTEAGFEIAGVATSAEEAVALGASERPILAVMDIRLDGRRDGIDAAVELFRTHGIRSVLATAHSDKTARRRAEGAAPLAWLPKPYSMASLVEVVRRALRELHDKNLHDKNLHDRKA